MSTSTMLADVQMFVRLVGALSLLPLLWLTYLIAQSVYRRFCLRKIPAAPGGLPLLGHLVGLVFHPLPWDYMASWFDNSDKIIMRWGIPLQDFVIVRGGLAMKTVLQTRFRDWNKEFQMSFHPFLCILGTGLVTSEGSLWQKQRKLMTPAFKGTVLDDVIDIGLKAVRRLMDKLDRFEGKSVSIEIEEEFRLLTLQVRISEQECSMNATVVADVFNGDLVCQSAVGNDEAQQL
jgi:hypothetical protein